MHALLRPIAIPKALHETLGKRQTAADMLAILLAVLAAVACWGLLSPAPDGLALWRQILALLLFLDIAAGAIANFTPGTNRFYAERPRHRWLFIAIHLHLPAIGLLLAAPMTGYWVVWAVTILGASLVNLLHGSDRQPLLAGLALCLGILLLPLLPLDGFDRTACLLFLLKVGYAFAVTHGGGAEVVSNDAGSEGTRS